MSLFDEGDDMYPENKHYSSYLASLPVPGDLAGFQCIENGKVLEGDLLVTEGRREWARGCVGWDVADLQRMLEIRTYRKMPVPRAALDAAMTPPPNSLPHA